MRRNDREFVPAEPRDNRLWSGSNQEPPRDFHQEKIANRVTKGVIDRLEPIKIEHGDSESAILPIKDCLGSHDDWGAL
jgi:hypothetical protein